MGAQIMHQMFSDQRALMITALVIGLLGLVPGMPNLVFLGLAGLMGAYAYRSSKKPRVEVIEATEETTADDNLGLKDLSWDDVRTVDIIGLEVGYRLIPLVDVKQGGKLLDRIKGVRRKLSEELGFLIHAVHIRDNLDLAPGRYRITLLGVAEGEADIHPDRELAINPGSVFGELKGIPTRDPAFGMDALWIEPAQRDHAQTLGYTVVDAGTVIATHLSKVLQEHAGDLLGHEEVQQLLNNLSQTAPKLVEDLVPKTLPLSTVVKVLQNLLAEGVPVRDMRTIAETLAEQAAQSQDADTLTAAVRVALRRMITRQINELDDELPAITLDPELEQILLNSLQSGTEGGLGVEPGLAERLYQSLAESAQRQEVSGQPAVLLVSPQLRPWLAGLIRHTVPALKVLAYNEIAENKQIRVISNIGNSAAVERLSPAA